MQILNIQVIMQPCVNKQLLQSFNISFEYLHKSTCLNKFKKVYIQFSPFILTKTLKDKNKFNYTNQRKQVYCFIFKILVKAYIFCILSSIDASYNIE